MGFGWLLRIGALAGVVVVLAPALERGWTHVETDFPNYYTAAVLTVRRAPLRNFYDWTWFQRQMNYSGTERQLGGYTPQPPLAMVPMLPLAGLPPQTAKRVWLSLNIVFLLAAIGILARLARSPFSGLLLLAMLGHNSLAGNFVLGQWYIFLLLLFSVSFWLLLSGRAFWGGVLLGAICLMKLYAAPFALYFIWKRKWRALAGMAAGGAVLALASVAWFGWQDNVYYVTHVFLRASAGEGADPYAPGLPTLSNLLRHYVMSEPELNPQPLIDAPAAFFFLQPFVTLAVLVFCLIALPKSAERTGDERRDLAWFLIALLLISFHRAHYVGVVFLLPIALLFENAGKLWRIWLIAAYLLLTISLPASWAPLFPVTWILLALYASVGLSYWQRLRPITAVVAAAAILGAAALSANRRLASYHREPAQQFERIATMDQAIYSASPAVSADGIVYESMGPGRYELVEWNQGQHQTLAFEGHAFHPSVAADGGPIYFELVAGGHSRIVAYDRESESTRELTSADLDAKHPAVSPDGQRLAFIARKKIIVGSGGELTTLNTPGPVQEVGWFPDAQHLVFSAGPPGRSQLYATVENGAPIQITHDSLDHSEPAVSPDGRFLAHTVERNGTRQIYIQDLSGGKSRQLTEGLCNSYAPAWQPDGRALIFASDCQRAVGLPSLYRWRIAGN
ncbi:MAG TPA: glycosyltransferase 87 family protein [Bryobacteraceae bacterium]|nr:glycosyltransferase 87 family protein [Bryobacteraceae bacterium]